MTSTGASGSSRSARTSSRCCSARRNQPGTCSALAEGAEPSTYARRVQLVAALPGALGRVHRGVGLADQVVRRRAGTAMLTPMEGSAVRSWPPSSCGADRAPAGARRSARPPNAPRRRAAARRTRRRRVARPCPCAQGAPQAVGDGDEQLVAGRVAERVVDRLEVVEVDEGDGHESRRPRGAAAAPARCGPEQRAVREAGQRVVQRAARSWDSSSSCSDASRMRRTSPPPRDGCAGPRRPRRGQPETGRVTDAQRTPRAGAAAPASASAPPRPPDARARRAAAAQRLGPAAEDVAHRAGEACSCPSASRIAIASPECSTSARSSASARLRRCRPRRARP